MKEEIFREYDIRGIYPEGINEDVAYLVGKYFGEKAESKYVFVGRDARLSSQALFESLAQGIIDGGARLVSLGEIPTPTLGFFNLLMEASFSIMITASHNSKEYNGFKMLYGDGKSFSGQDIQDLKEYVFSEKASRKINPDKYFHIFALEGEYALNIFKDIEIDPKLKIAWDLSNGVVANVMKHLVRIMPNENILLNDKIDGNFPAHPPDPTDHKNLKGLKEYVIKNNCDLGIGLDGDADRVVFVTSKGNILLGDQTLLIFANEVLSDDPNAYIIGDVKTSQIFYDEIKKNGGKTLMSKIGHSNVKDMIGKHKAKLAGEVSGHYYFSDKFIGTDDGVYSALRMIEIISKRQISLEEIYSKLPEFNPSNDIKIKIDDEKKFEIIRSLKNKMLDMGRDFINIDGVRYQDENGWWLIRASNTEPAINVRYEGKTKKDMQALEKDLGDILSEYGMSL